MPIAQVMWRKETFAHVMTRTTVTRVGSVFAKKAWIMKKVANIFIGIYFVVLSNYLGDGITCPVSGMPTGPVPGGHPGGPIGGSQGSRAYDELCTSRAANPRCVFFGEVWGNTYTDTDIV